MVGRGQDLFLKGGSGAKLSAERGDGARTRGILAREGEGSWRPKSGIRLAPGSSAKQIDKLEEQRAFLSARTEHEPTTPRHCCWQGNPVLPSRAEGFTAVL